tara:strand:+ start:756 stop:908 length:153 start_codon:yes stop_codon:yes gene_type:complete
MPINQPRRKGDISRPFLFAHTDPSRLAAVGSQSEQTSKQAQRLTNLVIGF